MKHSNMLYTSRKPTILVGQAFYSPRTSTHNFTTEVKWHEATRRKGMGALYASKNNDRKFNNNEKYM